LTEPRTQGRFTGGPFGSRVLVVHWDEAERRRLRVTYEAAGWSVLEASDRRESLRALYEHQPQAVVLDVSLEERWELLRLIKELDDVPLLAVTADDGDLLTVRALRMGADDCVGMPFSGPALIARTEAMVRRANAPAARRDPDQFHVGLLTVDFKALLVLVAGVEIRLTPLEFRVLTAFVRNPNHVLTPVQILEIAWHTSIGTRDQVKVQVGHLRRRLGAAGTSIETVRGVGYRFRPSNLVQPPKDEATSPNFTSCR
jgi:DNA-binding response OmpR family regulator